jgi:hypothetical protein
MIKSKNSDEVTLHSIYFGLKQEAIKDIQSIANYEGLKLSQSLTKRVGNYIENNLPKGIVIDKKQLLSEVLNEIFKLTDPEIKIITDQINFLVSSGQIQKIEKTMISKVGSSIYSCGKSFFFTSPKQV